MLVFLVRRSDSIWRVVLKTHYQPQKFKSVISFINHRFTHVKPAIKNTDTIITRIWSRIETKVIDFWIIDNWWSMAACPIPSKFNLTNHTECILGRKKCYLPYRNKPTDTTIKLFRQENEKQNVKNRDKHLYLWACHLQISGISR